MEIFENAGEYRHFKGGEYKVVCNVLSPLGELVLYKSVKSDSYWLRNADVFFQTIEGSDGSYARFKKVADFDDVLASLEYQEFLCRMKNGESITFEADMSQYKLSANSTLETPAVEILK